MMNKTWAVVLLGLAAGILVWLAFRKTAPVAGSRTGTLGGFAPTGTPGSTTKAIAGATTGLLAGLSKLFGAKPATIGTGITQSELSYSLSQAPAFPLTGDAAIAAGFVPSGQGPASPEQIAAAGGSPPQIPMSAAGPGTFDALSGFSALYGPQKPAPPVFNVALGYDAGNNSVSTFGVAVDPTTYDYIPIEGT